MDYLDKKRSMTESDETAAKCRWTMSKLPVSWGCQSARLATGVRALARAHDGEEESGADGAAEFYPMLPKMAVAVGKQCSVPGKFWDGCSAADKAKRFL